MHLDIQIGLTTILNNLRKKKFAYLGKILTLVLSVTDLIT